MNVYLGVLLSLRHPSGVVTGAVVFMLGAFLALLSTELFGPVVVGAGTGLIMGLWFTTLGRWEGTALLPNAATVQFRFACAVLSAVLVVAMGVNIVLGNVPPWGVAWLAGVVVMRATLVPAQLALVFLVPACVMSLVELASMESQFLEVVLHPVSQLVAVVLSIPLLKSLRTALAAPSVDGAQGIDWWSASSSPFDLSFARGSVYGSTLRGNTLAAAAFLCGLLLFLWMTQSGSVMARLSQSLPLGMFLVILAPFVNLIFIHSRLRLLWLSGVGQTRHELARRVAGRALFVSLPWFVGPLCIAVAYRFLAGEENDYTVGVLLTAALFAVAHLGIWCALQTRVRSSQSVTVGIVGSVCCTLVAAFVPLPVNAIAVAIWGLALAALTLLVVVAASRGLAASRFPE